MIECSPAGRFAVCGYVHAKVIPGTDQILYDRLADRYVVLEFLQPHLQTFTNLSKCEKRFAKPIQYIILRLRVSEEKTVAA